LSGSLTIKHPLISKEMRLLNNADNTLTFGKALSYIKSDIQ